MPSYLIEQEVKQGLLEELQYVTDTSVLETTEGSGEDESTTKKWGEAVLELLSSADVRSRSRTINPYGKTGAFPTLLDPWGIYLYDSSPTPCTIIEEELEGLLGESAMDLTKDSRISAIRALSKNKSAVWTKSPWADICAIIERLLECGAPTTGEGSNMISISVQGEGEEQFRECSTQEFQNHIISRIQGQAQLVEIVKLGLAVEIETELKNRLSEVWRLIREEEDLDNSMGPEEPATDRVSLGSYSRDAPPAPHRPAAPRPPANKKDRASVMYTSSEDEGTPPAPRRPAAPQPPARVTKLPAVSAPSPSGASTSRERDRRERDRRKPPTFVLPPKRRPLPASATATDVWERYSEVYQDYSKMNARLADERLKLQELLKGSDGGHDSVDTSFVESLAKAYREAHEELVALGERLAVNT
ncbi:hypothetical protein FRC11_014548 [Ceratobasidium sp. 423]|nr:hypothetical protein FRC11_014548 [Ceratobasidium sp. 423]